MSIDLKNFKQDEQNHVQSEINSIKSNAIALENVNILGDMIKGNDLSRYGDRTDKIYKYIQGRASLANSGDVNAQNEINAIRSIIIQAPLLERIKFLNTMGELIQVGQNEEIRFPVYELQGERARQQASSSAFPFATVAKRTEIMNNYKTVTGGIVVQYKDLSLGDLNKEAEMVEQVQTDMYNQMLYYILNELYTGYKNATSLKNFSEDSGIAQSALDAGLLTARRFSTNGAVTIAGDYSVVSQLNKFAGFAVDATTGLLSNVRYSEAVMNDLMNNGLLSRYYKHPIVEIGNGYNFTQLNEAGNFYETYLPEGLLFLLPEGAKSPLKVGIRGGVETMTGQDINTRSKVQRFDIEFGTHLVKEHMPAMGMIVDTEFAVDKRQ